jgi:hypothetical protein
MDDDSLNVPLDDPVLLTELELMVALMVAALSEGAAESLRQDEIDRILGIEPPGMPEKGSGSD